MSDSLGILVEAKKEYTHQLCMLMCPVMIGVFQDMYEEAVRMSKNKKPLLQFQALLRDVPNWSNAMSKKHEDNVVNRCTWFSDLLAAVFVSHVKILSSVRLRSDSKKISLKLPNNGVFIQTCYNNCAKALYNDPYVYHEEMSEHVRDEKLTKRFCDCIETTVKELIPVQQILSTYMGAMDKNIDVGEEETSLQDALDPEITEDDELPQQEAPNEAEDAPGETTSTDMMEAAEEVPAATPPVDPPMQTPELNEFRTIDTQRRVPEPVTAPAPDEPESAPEPAPAPEPEAYFNDAPEGRVKKPLY
jgi:hypothetical protein